MVTNMIYTNAEILAVSTNYVTVYNSNIGQNISVYLPCVISKLPVVGDHIVYDKDDVDYSNGMFVCYYNESPIVPTSGNHIHQLLSDDIVNNMALNASQKAEMKAKRTGGVK